MNYLLKYCILIYLFIIPFCILPKTSLYTRMRSAINHHADTTWTIIGAGPAGIATIGMLFDSGIEGKDMRWIDPHFDVGRLGAFYYHVPGNALAENYISFVNECKTFQNCSSPALTYLRNYYPYECCTLQVAIDALRDITTYLQAKLTYHTDMVDTLQFIENNWVITLKNGTSFSSHNVVLATGSHPKILNYPCEHIISLDDALDKTKLAQHIQPNDTIALIGGSHSGMLVLKYLYELNAPRIINFYKHPITYAYDMGNNNIPDYNGLKGDVAEWAFDILEQQQPTSIVRIKNTPLSRNSWLPLCNKIIYAVGYERNELPLLNINSNDLPYDDKNGTIALRLFCIGIAFPEKIIDPWGKPQHTVGMIDFLLYAQRIVPNWIKKGSYQYLYQFESLFNIHLIQQ